MSTRRMPSPSGTHFVDGKRHVYFTATRQDSERRQVDCYAMALREQLGEDVADLIGGGFTDWEAALRFALWMAAEQPLIVVRYEITDPYLAFWFAVLRADADLVEGGQGRAVPQRIRERWQVHLGRVFEEAAREHAVRLV